MIQLVAISLADEVTTLQIVSLSLSLFSVACKAFQLCRSFTTWAFWAKYFFIAHDLFKMAFVMSAILTTTGPNDVALFDSDSVFVTKLSYAWIIVKLVVVGVSLGCGLALFVRVMKEADDCEDRCLRPLAMIMIFCLGAGPFLIVQETIFLSALVIFNATVQPNFSLLPQATLLHEFLWQGDSSKQLREVTDWKKTFNKLLDLGEEYSKKPPKNSNRNGGENGDGGASEDDDDSNRRVLNANAAARRQVAALRKRRRIQTNKNNGNFRCQVFRQLQQPFISSSIMPMARPVMPAAATKSFSLALKSFNKL